MSVNELKIHDECIKRMPYGPYGLDQRIYVPICGYGKSQTILLIITSTISSMPLGSCLPREFIQNI